MHLLCNNHSIWKAPSSQGRPIKEVLRRERNKRYWLVEILHNGVSSACALCAHIVDLLQLPKVLV